MSAFGVLVRNSIEAVVGDSEGCETTKKGLEVAVWLLIILATLYLARSRRINSEVQPEIPQTKKHQTAV